MRARGWVLAGVLGLCAIDASAQSKTDPKPIAVDIATLKPDMIVLQDGKRGTYVVYNPRKTGARAWYGTGKVLYEQVITGRSANGDGWGLSTWAPRLAKMKPGYISYKPDGSFLTSCDGDDAAALTEITGDKAKAVLDKSQFLSPAMTRVPHLFARDDRGVYYYVDRLSKLHGGKGFRVFVGKKGAMKLLPLTDVASDSAGEVFSTKTGDLRIVKTQHDGALIETVWIKGERRTVLLQLDLEINSPIIFSELGIYKFTGTICENV